jgi:hypothetical protein
MVVLGRGLWSECIVIGGFACGSGRTSQTRTIVQCVLHVSNCEHKRLRCPERDDGGRLNSKTTEMQADWVWTGRVQEPTSPRCCVPLARQHVELHEGVPSAAAASRSPAAVATVAAAAVALPAGVCTLAAAAAAARASLIANRTAAPTCGVYLSLRHRLGGHNVRTRRASR